MDFVPGKSNKKPAKFFYGWVIVFACMLLYGGACGIFSNCFSNFIKPVTESLNVSRGSFTLYSTISGFVGMIAVLVLGELYRRHPLDIRKFMIYGCVVCCSVFVGYSFATKLIHFYILAGIYGCAWCTLTGLTITSLINNWFVEKRGLAMGLSYAGSGIVGSIMMPVVSWTIENYGWRNGFRLMAAASAVLITISILLVRVLPENMGLTPLGISKEDNKEEKEIEKTGLTRNQAVKTPAYWLLNFGVFLIGITGMGVASHVVAFLTDIGYSSVTASSVMSVVLVVMIGAKICMGFVFDKLGPVWSSVFTGECMVISIVAVLFAGAASYVPWIFAVCFGFGWSTIAVPGPYLLGENFGTREFAGIYVICSLCQDCSNALSSSFAGYMYDKFGNYYPVWYVLLALALIAGCSLTMSSWISRKKNYARL